MTIPLHAANAASPVYFAKRIILMSGDDAAQASLAEQLSEFNPKLAAFDLDAPLYDCLISLRGEEYSTEVLNEPFPGTTFNNREVIRSLRTWASITLRPDFLSRRAINWINELSSMSDCFAITGIRRSVDLLPFRDTFPPDELVHLALISSVDESTIGADDVETWPLLITDSTSEQIFRASLKVISPTTEGLR